MTTINRPESLEYGFGQANIKAGSRIKVSETILILFIALSFFQNIISLVVFNVLPELSLPVVGLKDALLLVGIAYLSARNFIKGRLDRLQITYISILVLLLGLWVVEGATDLTAFRTVASPVILILFGFLCAPYIRVAHVVKWTLYLFAVVVFLALVERFLLYDSQESFWRWMRLSDYILFKDPYKTIDQIRGVPGVTPANFYTSDFRGLDGLTSFRPRRLITLTMIDALLFAHGFVFVCAYQLGRGRWLRFLFSSVVMLLTLAKGGMLALYLAGGLVLAKKAKSRTVVRLFQVGILLSVAVWIGASFSLIKSPSMIKHVEGFTSGMTSLVSAPLGQGIGSGGNHAARKLLAEGDSTEDETLGNESFIGSSLVQIGFFTVIIFGHLILIAWRLYKSDDRLLEATGAALLGTIVAAFLSESAISYTGTGFIFIIAGAMYSQQFGRSRKLPPSPSRRRILAPQQSPAEPVASG